MKGFACRQTKSIILLIIYDLEYIILASAGEIGTRLKLLYVLDCISDNHEFYTKVARNSPPEIPKFTGSRIRNTEYSE